MEKEIKISPESPYASFWTYFSKTTAEVNLMQENHKKAHNEPSFELAETQKLLTSAALWLKFYSDISNEPKIFAKVNKIEKSIAD